LLRREIELGLRGLYFWVRGGRGVVIGMRGREWGTGMLILILLRVVILPCDVELGDVLGR